MRWLPADFSQPCVKCTKGFVTSTKRDTRPACKDTRIQNSYLYDMESRRLDFGISSYFTCSMDTRLCISDISVVCMSMTLNVQNVMSTAHLVATSKAPANATLYVTAATFCRLQPTPASVCKSTSGDIFFIIGTYANKCLS